MVGDCFADGVKPPTGMGNDQNTEAFLTKLFGKLAGGSQSQIALRFLFPDPLSFCSPIDLKEHGVNTVGSLNFEISVGREGYGRGNGFSEDFPVGDPVLGYGRAINKDAEGVDGQLVFDEGIDDKAVC